MLWGLFKMQTSQKSQIEAITSTGGRMCCLTEEVMGTGIMMGTSHQEKLGLWLCLDLVKYWRLWALSQNSLPARKLESNTQSLCARHYLHRNKSSHDALSQGPSALTLSSLKLFVCDVLKSIVSQLGNMFNSLYLLASSDASAPPANRSHSGWAYLVAIVKAGN